MRRSISHAFRFCCLSLALLTPVRAQDAPLSDRHKTAAEEQAYWEAKAKAAEARNQYYRERFAAPSAKTPEGTAEVEGAKMEATVLAYDTVADIARAIAAEVKAMHATKIAVYDQAEVDALFAYKTFVVVTQGYLDQYPDLLRKAKTDYQQIFSSAVAPNIRTSSLGPVSAAISTGLDLFGLFRSDVKVSGVELLPTEESAVVAEVSRHLKGKVVVYYPRFFNPATLQPLSSENSEIFSRLKQLSVHYAEAQAILQAMKDRISELEGKGDGATDEEKKQLAALKLALVKTPFVELGRLNKGVEKLFEDLPLADAGQSSNLVTRLIKAESLGDELNCPTCFVLYLKPQAAGGSNIVKRNLFTTVFTGNLIRHTGGSVISYIIFGRNGEVLSSATLHNLTRPIKGKNIKNNLERPPADGGINK